MNNLSRMKQTLSTDDSKGGKGSAPKPPTTATVTTSTATTVQSIVIRPEDLQIKPCLANNSAEASPSVTEEQSSNPLLAFDERIAKPELISTRNSSVESESSKVGANIQRKAYMDLRDAIALLDETCPNPDLSPSLTPRTPRTPLTPHPRNKRARSKSSDNSSNYSNDRLSEKSAENTKVQEKSKKRPFLRKIGISMTEERPFLAKLAPKIIGKPYLEKIGPSKAVEKPFLDKIGSSKTLDKFIFELPRSDATTDKIIEENEKCETSRRQDESKSFSKRSGKGFLLKMYSFETEDLEDASMKKNHRDPLRGASLDDVLDQGSNSLPCMENVEQDETREPYAVELVKCKVTMSEEVLSSSTCLSSSVEGPMWENSPRRKRKTKKFLAESVTRKEGLRSDESVQSSPVKRHLAATDADNAKPSPTKSKRQVSEDILDKKCERHANLDKSTGSSDNLFTCKNLSLSNMKCDDNKSSAPESSVTRTSNHNISKEIFKQLYNKFESQEVPTESYAAFKQRTRANLYSTSTFRRMVDVQNVSASSLSFQSSSKEIKFDNEQLKDRFAKPEAEIQIRSRSVLQKQDGIDHASDQECDNNPTTTLNKPKKRIFHEPSQETVDLLTELRKVKSLLKTPSFEKDLDADEVKSLIKQPKKVLLTDKEFSLSVERENSVRKSKIACNQDSATCQNLPILGPAFFEKRCLSLDYADDEKSQKSDIRPISLNSIKHRPSEVEETSESTPICDSKSYCSDVFTSPSDEPISYDKKQDKYSTSEIDISIPVDERGGHPAVNIQNYGRTTDQYEIMSPRVTPFKMKKRLGKISVEDAMKQESFAINKANCRSVAMQKKTKCFPL